MEVRFSERVKGSVRIRDSVVSKEGCVRVLQGFARVDGAR